MKNSLHETIRSLAAPLVRGLDALGLTPTILTFLGLSLIHI